MDEVAVEVLELEVLERLLERLRHLLGLMRVVPELPQRARSSAERGHFGSEGHVCARTLLVTQIESRSPPQRLMPLPTSRSF